MCGIYEAFFTGEICHQKSLQCHSLTKTPATYYHRVLNIKKLVDAEFMVLDNNNYQIDTISQIQTYYDDKLNLLHNNFIKIYCINRRKKIIKFVYKMYLEHLQQIKKMYLK